MLNAYMNEQDVPSAKEAEAFVTVGEQRYNLLNGSRSDCRQGKHQHQGDPGAGKDHFRQEADRNGRAGKNDGLQMLGDV